MSPRSSSGRALAVSVPISLGVLMLSLCLPAQGSGSTLPENEWIAKVKNAVENPRYALRRAISAEIARAGDAAAPAVMLYQLRKGRDKIPMLLVDAIARADAGVVQTLSLLRTWADDREFFWRAQALGGLAHRARPDDAERFRAAVGDPSHLFRVAGARGLHALAKAGGEDWTEGREILADPDPRARVLLALALWDVREPAALPVLVAALADDRAFLGDAWGRRYALQVHQALRRAANSDFGYRPGASLADNTAAIAKVAAWAEVPMPPLLVDEGIGDRGGIEIRSCRHGDLFLRWTDAELHVGLDRSVRMPVAKSVIDYPRTSITPVLADGQPERQTLGVVVCDYIQYQNLDPVRLWRMAPGSVPAVLANFCQRLVAACDAVDHGAVAAALRSRLPQFVRGN